MSERTKTHTFSMEMINDDDGHENTLFCIHENHFGYVF